MQSGNRKKIAIKDGKHRKDPAVTILFIKQKKNLLIASFYSNVLHMSKKHILLFQSLTSVEANGTSQSKAFS